MSSKSIASVLVARVMATRVDVVLVFERDKRDLKKAAMSATKLASMEM